MTPTVAVTGAGGFIGRHVVRELSHRGIPHATPSRAELDIARDQTNAYVTLGRPGALIHLAWSGLPNYRNRRHLEAELPAQVSFLKQLVRQGLPHLVVAGTCLEYGMQEGELSEATPAVPATAYAQAKHRLYQQLVALQNQHAFTLCWARLFYTYGEGQGENSLWTQLRRAAAAGQKRFPMSGGQQVRDFLPVEEIAGRLVDLAMLRRDVGVVNVCSGEPTTIETLVRCWCRTHGWKVELDFGQVPYPDFEPMSFWGSPEKLRRILESADATY